MQIYDATGRPGGSTRPWAWLDWQRLCTGAWDANMAGRRQPLGAGRAPCAWQRWATREEPWLAIITWVERTYHRRRRQRRLGRLTPVEYETLNLAATAA
ncbi:hypothetical protein GCM10023328_11520 [Modestobacter marinus]|uniref:Transposase n=1 Tax=Modestobacter marinus TaxID=477641 RepID=A0ABQ2G680_9ACTN|nr:hypothetical protein GCM10011589_35870 [Modestobacter marinus]